jgi:arylsulfatase A-like enzyme
MSPLLRIGGLLLAVGLWVAAPAATAPTNAARPNILLILSDDHSVPHLGCYGSPNAITPNLDGFAAQGMRFDRAYTTSPQCAPSRASIFFGRSPVALGVTRFLQPARPENVLFTDVLRENGYWAGAAGRGTHLNLQAGMAPNIDAAMEEAGLKYAPARFDLYQEWATRGDALVSVGDRFARVLDQIPAGKPFFLYFGFTQPHRPYEPVCSDEAFDPAKLKLPPDWPDRPEVRADYALFLRSVYDLDRGFGQLMKVLESRALSQNTLVVFMGDNGEAQLRGKGTLYERGNHVPLLVRWPGVVSPGGHSDILISGEDLPVTLLAAAGLPAPKEMTGVSFLSALQGRAFSAREYVFTERGWHGSGAVSTFEQVTRTSAFDLSRAITSRRHALIYNTLPERPFTPLDMADVWRNLTAAHEAKLLPSLHERLYFTVPRPVFELYDLEADPYELNNLSGQAATAEIERTLRSELVKWMVREGDFLPLPALTDGASSHSGGAQATPGKKTKKK